MARLEPQRPEPKVVASQHDRSWDVASAELFFGPLKCLVDLSGVSSNSQWIMVASNIQQLGSLDVQLAGSGETNRNTCFSTSLGMSSENETSSDPQNYVKNQGPLASESMVWVVRPWNAW